MTITGSTLDDFPHDMRCEALDPWQPGQDRSLPRFEQLCACGARREFAREVLLRSERHPPLRKGYAE